MMSKDILPKPNRTVNKETNGITKAKMQEVDQMFVTQDEAEHIQTTCWK